MKVKSATVKRTVTKKVKGRKPVTTTVTKRTLRVPRKKRIRGAGVRVPLLLSKAKVSSPKTPVTMDKDSAIIQTVPLHTSQATNTIILDQLVCAEMAPRLKSLAQCYQSVKFISVALQIKSTFGALTSGSYVAAYVADPSDTPVNQATWFSAQAHNVVAAYRESVSLSLPPTTKSFFTDPSSELRTFSPGRFVVMAIDAPSQSGSLIFHLTWKVAFSKPTIGSGVSDAGSEFVQVEQPAYIPWGEQDTDVDRALALYNGTGDSPYWRPNTVNGSIPSAGVWQLSRPTDLIVMTSTSTASDGAHFAFVTTNLLWHDGDTAGNQAWYPLFWSAQAQGTVKLGWCVVGAGKGVVLPEYAGYTSSKAYGRCQTIFLQEGDYLVKLASLPNPAEHPWHQVLVKRNFIR